MTFTEVMITLLTRVDRLCRGTCPYVCPQIWLNEARTNIGLWIFSDENDSLAYFAILENCRHVCLLLWAFSRL